MFTGIVQTVGTIEALEPRRGDMRLRVAAGELALDKVRTGDSISVNGVCLTVFETTGQGFTADVSGETLALTALGRLRAGSRVNLEPALTLGTPLGGHLVSGHVDGIGEVISRKPDARSVRLEFKVPQALMRYIARKGSICVDGVSLTVNAVQTGHFTVNIVPHTLAATIIGDYQPASAVNIEVDLIARYLERLAQTADSPDSINYEALQRHGFV